MKYLFECPKCGAKDIEIRPVDERDNPKKCPNDNKDMNRIFGKFFFTADRAQDKAENQALRIETRSSSRKDWAEAEKRYAKKVEAQPEEQPHKYFGAEDILATGIVEASKYGKQGIDKWRQINDVPAENDAE